MVKAAKKREIRATKFQSPDYMELGVSGLKQSSGYIGEEFKTELQGERGVKVYQEMADSDATCGAILYAIKLLLQSSSWSVEPANGEDDMDHGPDEYVEFVISLMSDMSHTWSDLIGEALSCLEYGWSYFEVLPKRRGGPDHLDPAQRSAFSDGRIGIRKISRRSQNSLERWEFDESGGIKGMWQRDPNYARPTILLPIERCLLFRTRAEKNNPEGRSLLRNAYRSWWKMSRIEDYEAVGVERELVGMPVVSMPAGLLTSTDSADAAFVSKMTKIARDLKFNEQAGVVIPSDTFRNPDGTYSAVRMVSVELLKSPGSRALDTDKVILRYQRGITRSVLADFLALGGEAKGSYALSKSKTELFLKALEYLQGQIASVLNRYLLPRVWAWNGFPLDRMPYFCPGTVAPTDLQELGAFIRDMALAGAPMFPDPALENQLRMAAGLPAVEAEGDEGDQ